jgi:50S ribosomal protein L16 3-hydroxylase
MTPIDKPCALLGGLTPADFMRHYWQKKPLLIRSAIPGFKAPVSRAELFALAQRDEVESRLVVQNGPKNRASSWSLTHGPFARRAFAALKPRAWTLLVQGVNLYDPRAHEILEMFHFIPRVRLDDLMISYASDQGGVGPHLDSYDVFLLQAHGERRWRIASSVKEGWVRGAPLKILSHFKSEQEWVLSPGDMLYLPPSYAHEGVAQGECMTYSIGFNAPRGGELAQQVMSWMADEGGLLENGRITDPLYSDSGQPATLQTGEIPKTLQNFAFENYQRLALNELHFQRALGERLTEPKPHVWFEASQDQDTQRALKRLKRWVAEQRPERLKLDRQTQMLFDEKFIFINAESLRATAQEAKILRTLANKRVLRSSDLLALLRLAQREVKAKEARTGAQRRLETLLGVLEQWMHSGWLHWEE